MIVQSGQLPYQYNFTLPIRGRFGPSGILFEQAMFVLKAEDRRYNNASSFDFKLYTHEDITPEVIEPTPNGTRIANSGSLHFIDYIEDMRTGLISVFTNKSDDSGHPLYSNPANTEGEGIFNDYFKKLYPSTPSGNIGDFNHRILPSTGLVLEGTPDVLGISGIFYDIDIGEVMYQPYPHLRDSDLPIGEFNSDLQNPLYGAPTRPLAPCFMRTDGQLLSFNDRAGMPWATSGKIRVQGDVLLPQTEFILRNANNTESTFGTYFFGSARAIGVSHKSSPFAEVFITPNTQNTGLYQVGVKNNLPHCPITSGIASVWPRNVDFNKTRFPTYVEIGFHVFNDTLWQVYSLNYPSGSIAAISPLVGGIVGEQPAFGALSSGGGGFGGVSFINQTGLEIFGSNIYRAVRSNNTAVVKYQKWATNLDYIEEVQLTYIRGPQLIGTRVDDFTYIDTTWYTLINSSNSAILRHAEPTFGFAVTDRFIDPTGLEPSFERIFNIDNELWAQHETVPLDAVIERIELDDTVSGFPGTYGDIIYTGDFLTFDYTGFVTLDEIIEFETIQSATHISNGLWGLGYTEDLSEQRYYITRFTKSGNALTAVEQFQTGVRVAPGFGATFQQGMIYMSIN